MTEHTLELARNGTLTNHTQILVHDALVRLGPQNPKTLTESVPRSHTRTAEVCVALYKADVLDRRTDPNEPRTFLYSIAATD